MNPYLVGIVVPFVFSYILSKKSSKQRGLPVDVGGEPGYAIRNYRFTSPIETQWEEVTTLAELFKLACKNFATKRMLGTRKLISSEIEVTADGRSFEKFHFGKYEWLSYNQAYDAVCNFASGIVQRVAIFADTRAEWMIALQGCLRRNITIVTIYASCHSLNETEVSTVVCGHKELIKLIGRCREDRPGKSCCC
ncbi:uncharacterized protein A4U43_UnF11670 [Asparagus officinalis]|uniref:AMP-dependent synthetase/ligase domain-containing protein n=1 Tax=Asparagus officinalis TaxID=4686 RepID=A0A1R3L581_ASPOF|nr:uncharacterized protein A4U43_UnF11670 [Asparagus officinalis]